MIEDISNKRFGMLVAIKPTLKRVNRCVIWVCKCDCGNYKEVNRNSLQMGLIKSCGCIHRFIDRESVYRKVIVSRVKGASIRKSRQFSIDDNTTFDLSQKSCEYCGLPPSNHTLYKADNLTLYYNGLDRIDSTKGYLLDNVVPCCKRCNIAKNNMTLAEFKDWIARVYNTTIQQKKENI